MSQGNFAGTHAAQTMAVSLAISLLLVAPPLYVALTDGVWWAWSGVAFFGGLAGYFGWLPVGLRADRDASPTT